MAQKSLTINRIDARTSDAVATLRARLGSRGDVVSPASRQRTIDVFGEPLSPAAVVERICGEVEREGLAALLRYSARLDGAKLTGQTLRVPEEDLTAAHRAVEPAFLETVRRIRENVLRFQRAILHHDVEVPLESGGFLRQRYLPLARVGLCIPGGAAAYPSTLLMTAMPAQAAGVAELAVVAPPTKFGAYNREMLATCHELGIREVYRMGGAQAVAALAYGVEGVPRVDKIVGPGNLYVALAKKHVFGTVAIDSIAGPSEVVVVADDEARAELVAADLIAQAEHSPGASILISWSRRLLDEVADQLVRQLDGLERGDLARQSLIDFGALVEVASADEAARLADAIAPEHLHLQTADDAGLLTKIRSAGAAFLGPYSPVALGDYVAGPSHVLPTGGTARFASGLSANDFLRSTSVIHYTADDLEQAAPDLERMACTEGLTGHWASVARRLAGRKEAP